MALPTVSNLESSMTKSSKPKDAKTKAKQGQKMWGGRFSAEPGALMQAINVSIDFDRKLADQDIAGSKAHSDMLAAQGIITAEDRDAIHAGLDEIAGRLHTGRSRNDQVATDFRLWVRDYLDQFDVQLSALMTALLNQAADKTRLAQPPSRVRPILLIAI